MDEFFCIIFGQKVSDFCNVKERLAFVFFFKKLTKNEIAELFQKLCKGVQCVDLGESFPTSIYLQYLASIQPRTSLVKFARSPRTDPPGGA